MLSKLERAIRPVVACLGASFLTLVVYWVLFEIARDPREFHISIPFYVVVLIVMGGAAVISAMGFAAYGVTRWIARRRWCPSLTICFALGIVSTVAFVELQRGPDRPIIGLIIVVLINFAAGLLRMPRRDRFVTGSAGRL